MDQNHSDAPTKLAKHDIMYNIKDLCRRRQFRKAFKYSQNFIKYSKYGLLIIIYGSLATKYRKSQLKYIKTLSTLECANLINQYNEANLMDLNLHEHAQAFLSFVLNVLVARLLVTQETKNVKLSVFLKMWIDKNLRANDFEISLRKFVKLADMRAPRNLFVIFVTLNAYSFEPSFYLLSLKWEVIIRAVAFRLNAFESMKTTVLSEDDLLAEEKNLSKLYIDLTRFCTYNPTVQMEFLLTAFSLYPAANMYNVIQKHRNNIRNQWVDEIFSGRLYDPLGQQTHRLTSDSLEQLGNDIVSIIMEPRNKLIKSDLEWPILNQNLCQLLNKEYKLNFVRYYKLNANSYLKFLNLKYSQFSESTQEQSYEESLAPTSTVDSDYMQVEDRSNTIEVSNASVYGFKRFLHIKDGCIQNGLRPFVFIVPLNRNISLHRNKFVCLRPVPPAVNGSCARIEVKRKAIKKSCC